MASRELNSRNKARCREAYAFETSRCVSHHRILPFTIIFPRSSWDSTGEERRLFQIARDGQLKVLEEGDNRVFLLQAGGEGRCIR